MKCRTWVAILLTTLLAGRAAAIDVSFGEGYVEHPNTRGDDDFINLGYGIDPIPAKSPVIRFNDWRAYRLKMRSAKSMQRYGVPPAPEPVAPLPRWETIPPGEQPGIEARRPVAPRASSRPLQAPRSTPRQF